MNAAEIAATEKESGASHSTRPPYRRSRSLINSDYLWAYAMIAPLVLGLLVFYGWPIIQTFYFSFTTWGAFGKYQWSGLDNYKHLLGDPEVGRALANTFVFTILSVPGSIIVSLPIAVLLNQKIRGVAIYRTLYFLPVVTMPAAVALIWKWLYNGDYGLINYALRLASIRGPYWLSDPHTALYAVIVVSIWGSVGYNMVLFLSGLQAIPLEYHEAAALDGAGPFSRFFHVTLPLLSPTIFFAVVISMISAFQVFDLVFLMFGSSGAALGATNPALGSTETIVYLFYKNAFMLDNKGYAAAIAMLLFVIILIVTIIQFRLQKRWVHYV